VADDHPTPADFINRLRTLVPLLGHADSGVPRRLHELRRLGVLADDQWRQAIAAHVRLLDDGARLPEEEFLDISLRCSMRVRCRRRARADSSLMPDPRGAVMTDGGFVKSATRGHPSAVE